MTDQDETVDDNNSVQISEPQAKETKVVPPTDLSAEIAASVERNPGDVVKCTRVGVATYRCNWWAAQSTGTYDNPNLQGPTYGTHVIRLSRFVRASRTPSGLVVADVVTKPNPRW